LAVKCSLSDRQVKRVIKLLIAKRVIFVQRDGKGRAPNCYRFYLDESGNLIDRSSDNLSIDLGEGGDISDPVVVTSEARSSDTGVTQIIRTVNEPSMEIPKGDYYPQPFEDLWAAYPRRTGKKAAYRKVKTLLRRDVTYAMLQGAVEMYAISVKGTEPRFVKLAATFFGPDDHWREWADEPSVSVPVHKTVVSDADWEAELVKRHAESAPPPSDFAKTIRKQMMGGLK
jgi:hypothetical protein